MIVNPIKEIEKLQTLFKTTQNPRNKLLLVVCYCACLRISDALKIKVGDLKKDTLEIKEQKTGKVKELKIEGNFRKFINDLLPKWQGEVKKRWKMSLKDDDYVFVSQLSKAHHMTRQQAYRIVIKEAKKAGIHSKIGTHSMRKSAAWQAYKKDGIAGAQRICNHSSPVETIRYLGVTKEFEQKVYNHVDDVLGFID